MRTAATILSIMRDRGRRGLPVEGLYRHLYNPDLYLRAYAKLYPNKGALTPGITPETVDGMSRRKIDAIIEAGLIRFKTFGVLKQIFDMFEVYREATNQDIRDFSELENIQIEDVDALCASANRTARKLIFSVSRSGILQQKTTAEIRDSAAAMEIPVEIENDKLVIPTAGPELTRVLKFLDHSIYRSPLTNERWLANSRRRLG